MIKKIFFIIFVFLLIYSCGKKGDPKYKEKQSEISNIDKSIII